MYKHLSIICLALLCAFPISAQVRIKGMVIDAQTNEGIPFATVVLRSQRDTTQVSATITDLNGGYMFEYMKPGPHTLEISCLGYVPLQKRKRVGMPSVGHVLEWSDTLQVDAKQIEEVRITGAKPQTADRKVYTFSAVEVKQAQHGRDLLKNLPMLETDMVNGTLRGVGGKSVLLLLNGVAATENEVRAIPPHKIKRTEVYDIPPARYSGVDYVINIVTSELSTGISGGFNLQHAFTTGFINDNAFLSVVSGKHKITAEYYLNLRNYNDCRTQTTYDYLLNGIEHNLNYNNKEHFGYTDHTPKLKYAYGNLDKQIFEFTLRPNISTRFSHENGTGTYSNSTSYTEALNTKNSDDSRTIAPSVDLYYWRKFTDSDEFSANVAGTYFDTRRSTQSHEMVGDTMPIFYDTLSLHNNKSSVIGELVYTRNMGTMQFNVGYRAEYALLNSNYHNGFGHTNYRSDHVQQYGYAEATGMMGHFLYRISLGMKHFYTKSIYDRYSKPMFTPMFLLGYTKGGHTVRFVYTIAPDVPSINDLSSNASYLSRHIIERGNPLLRNSINHAFALVYSISNPYLELSAAPIGAFGKNTHIIYFDVVDNHYEKLRSNADYDWGIGAILNVDIKPFGNNVLHLRGMFTPVYDEMQSEKVSFAHLSLSNNMSIVLNIKDFTLQGQLAIPVYEIKDGMKKLTEQFSAVSLAYKLKNWRFTAGMLWFGTPSHYRTETLDGSAVRYTHDRSIYNNKNMFTFGVSYHFGKGSDWDYQRKLQNEDTTAPSN